MATKAELKGWNNEIGPGNKLKTWRAATKKSFKYETNGAKRRRPVRFYMKIRLMKNVQTKTECNIWKCHPEKDLALEADAVGFVPTLWLDLSIIYGFNWELKEKGNKVTTENQRWFTQMVVSSVWHQSWSLLKQHDGRSLWAHYIPSYKKFKICLLICAEIRCCDGFTLKEFN